MLSEEQVARIRATAEAILEGDLGEKGDVLTVAAGAVARTMCGREDVPEDMEPVVAQMLVTWKLYHGGVKSVTRGDTTITYEEFTARMREVREMLTPFCRLGRLWA